jgi:hypothetical protein
MAAVKKDNSAIPGRKYKRENRNLSVTDLTEIQTIYK